MKPKLTSNPDSITFTTEQLDDLIVCVRYSIREGIGYGHDTQLEENALAVERGALLAKLERFAATAKKRNAFRARKAQS